MRRCLDCPALISAGSRCAVHRSARKRVRNGERDRVAAAVAAHVAVHGLVCPGYGRAEHPSSDLTGDHVVALSKGGAGGEIKVLCRSCNARKGAR